MSKIVAPGHTILCRYLGGSFFVLYTLLQDFQIKTAPACGKSHILQDGSYRIVEEEQEAEATIKESVAV